MTNTEILAKDQDKINDEVLRSKDKQYLFSKYEDIFKLHPNEDAKIFRYIDQNKFESMLTKKDCFFQGQIN